MRLLSLALLVCSLALAGCGNEAKVAQPKDTVPPPKADEIIGGGTPMPAAKTPAKTPAKPAGK
ncbi:MAG: hypothetical protein JNJ77_08840 [Planctomycetia bacterium]|nr:hypothetical protein [Planctomycetia bacterium]